MSRAIWLLLLASLSFAQSAETVRHIEVDGRTIAYVEQGGFAVTEGDIIIGTAGEVETYRTGRGPRPRSIYTPGPGNSRLWPNATIYYTMDADVPLRDNLLAAIDYWNQVGPFKIVPRTSEQNYVTFRKIVADAACSSSVGMLGGQQFISVTTSCSVGAAIHELGHTWGLLHEQSRSDREAYVTVLYENIDKRFVSNFYQSASSLDAGFYDYDSIMHYSATGFSRNFGDSMATVPPGIPIGQRTGLSAGDTDAILRIYGVIPTETTIATTPAGLTVVVDGQTVTTPQKYTWTPGSQHTLSVPSPQGTTPRNVFARWSDGGQLSHTVTASADRTVYVAQFQRQYPVGNGVAAGSGTGTMTIFPAPVDGYLPDRQPFRLTATPDEGSNFVSWTGTTFLGTTGNSVSANPVTVLPLGAASNYQASFSTRPLHWIDSKPRGVQVTVDGAVRVTPVSYAWAEGSTHTITVASPQMQGNNTHRFTFRGWEDGSTGPRSVTATADGTTFTADFLEEYLLEADTSGNGTVRVSPDSADGFYEAGSTVNLTATPIGSSSFRYWVGDLAGNTAAQPVVMSEARVVLASFGSSLPFLVYHAASFSLNPTPGTTGQSVAPGEIVSIFGAGIGPSSAQSPKPDADGKMPTSVDSVSVTFDGTAAPITYAGPNQINVIVPYAVAGRTSTTVAVRRPSGNLTSAIGVVETMPGLFTYDGSGAGPVAALNQDGSINSKTNPADPGSVVVLYATGAGQFAKSFADGQIIGAELVAPKGAVYVRFDRLAGQVQYAGVAPYLVNGALQVNVVVPKDVVGGGQIPVRLTVGTYASAPGTTIWIR